MANSGADTNGSQFFIITRTPTRGLQQALHACSARSPPGWTSCRRSPPAGDDDSNGSGDGKPKLAITFTKITAAPPVSGSGTFADNLRRTELVRTRHLDLGRRVLRVERSDQERVTGQLPNAGRSGLRSRLCA